MASFSQTAEEALAAAHSFIWKVSRDGRILSRVPEPSFLFGLERNSLGPDFSHYLALIHPEDRPSVLSAWDALLKDGIPLLCEFRVLLPTREERRFLSRAVALRASDGAVLGAIGMDTDMTDVGGPSKLLVGSRVQNEQEVSQELNNRLQVILTTLELLRPELSSEKAKGLLSLLEAELWNIASVVGSMVLKTRPA